MGCLFVYLLGYCPEMLTAGPVPPVRCWLWGSMDACSYEDRHQVHLCYMSSLAPNLLGNSSLMDVFFFSFVQYHVSLESAFVTLAFATHA